MTWFWPWKNDYQPLAAGPLALTAPSALVQRADPDKAARVTIEQVSESSQLLSTSSSADLVRKHPKRTWRSNFWDTLDKSPEERRFLFKLDVVVLTFASLGYFIKNLDQVNINNAYVSGMRDDLGLHGNELNYMIACWTVGYVLGEVPSNLILTRVRPSIWIPACEVTWSLLTALTCRASSAQQLYVLRFLVGLAESTFYPGMQYVIGSWYRRDELAKRSCLFHAAGAVGSMVSGGLMAGVHRHLGSGTRHGLRGWQWLFVLDTAISLPIAVAGFFLLPDVPEIARAQYFTPDEIRMAQRRVALEGRARRGTLFSRAKLRRIAGGWHLYALVALYVCFNNGNGFGGQPAFQLWLQSAGYDVGAVNLWPMLTSLVQVVMTLVYAWTSDALLRGARWPPIVFAGCVNVVIYSSLAVWEIPVTWKWTCFLLTGCGMGISGLAFAWAHEICRRDNEERALVTGAMNEMAYVMQAWLPLVVWQQKEAPRYRKGFVSNVLLSGLMIVVVLVMRRWEQTEERERKGEESEEEEGEEVEQTA